MLVTVVAVVAAALRPGVGPHTAATSPCSCLPCSLHRFQQIPLGRDAAGLHPASTLAASTAQFCVAPALGLLASSSPPLASVDLPLPWLIASSSYPLLDHMALVATGRAPAGSMVEEVEEVPGQVPASSPPAGEARDEVCPW